MEELLSAQKAAALLGISKTTLYGLIRGQQITHIRIGKRAFFSPSLLEKWIGEHTVNERSTAV